MTGSAGRDVPFPAVEGPSFLSALATISVAAPVRSVASQVAVLAADLVPALDVCVTAIQPQHVPEVAFGRDRLAASLDERQYRPGYGPALTSATSGRALVLNERSGSRAFEDFRRLAARHGVRQVRAWPLHPVSSATCWGSLTVYGDGDDHGPEPEADRFGLFLAAAAVLVADSVVFNQAVTITEQMDQAMQSRAVIEQAKGMIMARAGCSADEAFERLKRISSQSNRKVRDVAAGIVQGAGPGPVAT